MSLPILRRANNVTDQKGIKISEVDKSCYGAKSITYTYWDEQITRRKCRRSERKWCEIYFLRYASQVMGVDDWRTKMFGVCRRFVMCVCHSLPLLGAPPPPWRLPSSGPGVPQTASHVPTCLIYLLTGLVLSPCFLSPGFYLPVRMRILETVFFTFKLLQKEK